MTTVYCDGRDLVLYPGQLVCGLKLAQAGGLKDYAAAVARYRKRLESKSSARTQLKRINQMLNVEM